MSRLRTKGISPILKDKQMAVIKINITKSVYLSSSLNMDSLKADLNQTFLSLDEEEGTTSDQVPNGLGREPAY